MRFVCTAEMSGLNWDPDCDHYACASSSSTLTARGIPGFKSFPLPAKSKTWASRLKFLEVELFSR